MWSSCFAQGEDSTRWPIIVWSQAIGDSNGDEEGMLLLQRTFWKNPGCAIEPLHFSILALTNAAGASLFCEVAIMAQIQA